MGPRTDRRRPGTLLLALLALGLLVSALTTVPAGTATAAPSGAGSSPLRGAAPERGVPPRAGEDFPRMPQRCYQRDGVTLKVAPCRIARYGSGRPTLVAWGDSHAWMYLPALRRQARAERVNLTLVVLGSCPVALPLPPSRGFGLSTCERHNVATLDFLKRLRKRSDGDVGVLVGGFWSGYRDAYARQELADRTGTESGLSDYQRHMSTLAIEGAPRMFARLGRMRLDVDLIGQAATVPLDAPECRAGRVPYLCDLPRSRALEDERANRRWIKRHLRAPLAGRPRLVDATPGYCSSDRCRARVRGANTYYDDIHLGADLSRQLTGYFRPVFADLR